MKFDYTKKQIEDISKEFHYTVGNIEKVLRLATILRYINSADSLRGKLLLKGGTAINLVVFSLPRLSVDIDLDYSENVSKGEMIKERSVINDALNAYISSEGYSQSTRSSYAVDSISLSYETLFGSHDKIKLDINYYNRCHIYEASHPDVQFPFGKEMFPISHLNPIELFAGKIKAFYERSKPRDVFDINMLANSNLLKKQDEKNALRKCAVYYLSLADDRTLINKDIKSIKDSPFQVYKQQLLPLLTKGIVFDKATISENVINYLSELMVLNDREKKYLEEFNHGNYLPSLLFDDVSIVGRLEFNPVALRVQSLLQTQQKAD